MSDPTPSTLLALAEKVEAAVAADRELDVMIYWAARNYQPKPGGFAEHAMKVAAPAYTASLDAAITLKPADWRIGFEENASCDEPGKSYAWCWPFESSYDPDWQMGQEGQQSNPDAVKGYAATPALALTTACLRARAAIPPPSSQGA